MRGRLMAVLLAAFLVCTGAVVLAAEEPAAGDPAMAALKRIADKSAAIQACQGSVTVSMTATQGGQTRTTTHTMAFRLAKPNKVRAVIETQSGTLQLASNGEKVWTYCVPSEKYLVEDAAKDVYELFSRPLYLQPLMAMTRLVFGPLSTDPYAALTRNLTSAELPGVEKLDGADVEHLRLHTRDSDLDLWADRSTGRIRKASVNPRLQLEMLRAQNPQLSDLQVVIEMVQDPDGKEAAALPDSFDFQPPQGATQAQNAEDLQQVELKGKPLRDFELEGLAEGSSWKLSEQKGKVIALAFWATSCGPCAQELPELQKVYRDLKDRGFFLLGVNLLEDRKTATGFLTNASLDFPVALDQKGSVGDLYGVRGLPTLVLIGRDGVIAAVRRGYYPGGTDEVRKEVERLLAAETPKSG